MNALPETTSRETPRVTRGQLKATQRPEVREAGHNIPLRTADIERYIADAKRYATNDSPDRNLHGVTTRPLPSPEQLQTASAPVIRKQELRLGPTVPEPTAPSIETTADPLMALYTLLPKEARGLVKEAAAERKILQGATA